MTDPDIHFEISPVEPTLFLRDHSDPRWFARITYQGTTYGFGPALYTDLWKTIEAKFPAARRWYKAAHDAFLYKHILIAELNGAFTDPALELTEIP